MTVLVPSEGLKLDLAAVRDLLPLDWSAGRDLNPRLYGFAGRSLGPLGHRRREPQRTGDGPRDGPGNASGRPQRSLVRAATAAVTEAAPASCRQAATALSVVPVRTTSSTTTM